MSPITLLNAESVHSFHTFIFSDEPAHAPYIYGLKLSVPFNYSDVQVGDHFLVALMKAAVHIQYLYFNHTSISDPMCAAVAEATTLHKVHAVCHPSHVRILGYYLTSFRSPLRSLQIEKIDSIFGNLLSLGFLYSRLIHLAPTLEALDLAGYHVELDIIQVPSSITPHFMAVRSLKFENTYTGNLDILAILLRLFPNLDNMLVLGCPSAYTRMDNYPAMQEQNLEAQKAHAWPGLDWLACNIDTAVVLALQCPIRCLGIEVPEDSAYHVKQYLANILRHNFATHLHLSLSFLHGLSVLDGLLTFEAANRLTHLAIAGNFRVHRTKGKARYKHKEIPWNRVFGQVVSLVKHLRLTHLRIVLHCTLHKPEVPSGTFEGNLMDTALPCDASVDLNAIAARCVNSDTMPCLEYLSLVAYGCAHTLRTTDRNGEWRSEEQTLPHQ
ncbi:hypothetical protein V8D89_007908 [Ganoderma adspersum]